MIQSSEWKTMSKEEEKTNPNDSQGYVLETGGYAVDLETKEIIMGEPVTFAGLADQFSEMILSSKSYRLETINLNDSDLETPFTVVRKRKLHEMLENADYTPEDELSIYRNKRSVPIVFDDSELLDNSSEK